MNLMTDFNLDSTLFAKYLIPNPKEKSSSSSSSSEPDLAKALDTFKKKSQNVDCGSIPCIHLNLLSDRVQKSKTTDTDIEMFTSYEGKEEGTLLNLIQKNTNLYGSKHALKLLLDYQTTDVSLLTMRQKCLHRLSQLQGEDKHKIAELLETLKSTEKDVAWFFTSKEPEVVSLLEILFFQFFPLKFMNKKPKCLTYMNIYQIIVSPLIGILSPICYFIVPFLVLKYKLGKLFPLTFIQFLKVSLSAMLAGEGFIQQFTGIPGISYVYYAFTIFFYFQGLFNSIEISKLVYQTMQQVVSKIEGSVSFFRAATALSKTFDFNLSAFSFDDGPLGTKSIDLHFPMIPEKNKNKSWKPLLLTDFGSHLVVHTELQKDIDLYLPLIHSAYIMDAIFAVSKLNFNPVKFTRTVVVKEDDTNKTSKKLEKNHLVIKGVWHPLIKCSVKNDITLDKSVIITGPNAGGKSTLIKSCLISVLFAQTFGVACCDHMTIEPYQHIRSQMMVPDCKGKESLFEAEMMRSKESLDAIADGQRSIIFMDEIFNSTNPIEGISGAYAIAKKMAEHPNSRVMITTHYLYLTKLAKETPSYKLLKMNVIENESEKFRYPYKVAPGISRQFIALSLLKERGFDESLINDANLVKKNLLRTAAVAKQPCLP